VAVAEDGDMVLLRAGSYPESVTVSRSITLRGDDPGEVFIEVGSGCSTDAETGTPVCPADVPVFERFWLESVPYGLLLEDTDAKVSDLGFHFSGHGSGIVVDGGAPVLSGITYDTSDDRDKLYVAGGSAATIRNSDLGKGSLVVKERSPVIVEDSHFGTLELNTGDLADRGMKPIDDFPPSMKGGPATIRGNRATIILFEGSPLVEGNEVGPPADEWPAIGVESGEGWIIRGNIVTGSTSSAGAILETLGAGSGSIADNTLVGNDVGISIASTSTVEGNTITEGKVGITVASEGSPSLIGNTVEGLERVGISIGPWSDPVLIGNRSCNNGKDIQIFGTRELTIDDSNEICVMPADE
jgi:parallel beta-helix repeat protein